MDRPVLFAGLHINDANAFSFEVNNIFQTIAPTDRFIVTAHSSLTSILCACQCGRGCSIHIRTEPVAEIMGTGPIQGGTWDFTITLSSNTPVFGCFTAPQFAIGKIFLSPF